MRNVELDPPCARRSTSSKPMLCRVPWYLVPGLPRPTTSFTDGNAGLPARHIAPASVASRRCSRRMSRRTIADEETDRINLFFLLLALGLDDLRLRRAASASAVSGFTSSCTARMTT